MRWGIRRGRGDGRGWGTVREGEGWEGEETEIRGEGWKGTGRVGGSRKKGGVQKARNREKEWGGERE